MKRTPTQSGAARARAGFSLIEVLSAIGILGIALPLAGALFLAAIKESQFAANNAVGSIICQNGLAVFRSKVAASDISSATLLPVTTTGSPLGPYDLLYPVPSQPMPASPAATDPDWMNGPSGTVPRAVRGTVILAAKMSTGNEYLLVVASYLKRSVPAGQAPHDVKWVPVLGTIVDHDNVSRLNVPASPSGLLSSPVVRDDGAVIGYVTGLGTNAAVLDRHAPADATSRTYFVVVETDSSGNAVSPSPFLSLLENRAGLK